MISVKTKEVFDLRIAIRDAIKNSTIDTWSHSLLKLGHSRLDWTGGQENNWPKINENIYFEVFKDPNDETNHTFKFLLHTLHGYHLDESTYACMHRELLYMLMAHFNAQLSSYTIKGPKFNKHQADVMDKV